MKNNVVQFPQTRVEPRAVPETGGDTICCGDGGGVIRIRVNLGAALPERPVGPPPKEQSLVPAYFAGIVMAWLFGA